MQEQFAEKVKCLKAKSEKQIYLTIVAFFDAKGLICALLKSIDVQIKVSYAVRLETLLDLSLCFGQKDKQSKLLSFENHCRAQKLDPEHANELPIINSRRLKCGKIIARTKNPVTIDFPVEK